MNRCFDTTVTLITIGFIHRFAVGTYLIDGHRIFSIVRSDLLTGSRSIPAVNTGSNLLEILSIFSATLLRNLALNNKLIQRVNDIFFCCG